MGFYYSPSEGYHEGDLVYPDDLPSLPRPDATYDPVMSTNPVSWSENAFRASEVKGSAVQALIDNLGQNGSDASMGRGVEDLISLLISKGVIARSDLSTALLTKINNRRSARGQAAL